MNANKTDLHLTLDNTNQVDEALAAPLHSILLHRTNGKLTYKAEGNYSIGTVGLEDVDCKLIDFTYTRINSKELADEVDRHCVEVKAALNQLPASETRRATLTLQFYQRSKWASKECNPWEIWNLNVQLRPAYQRQHHPELVSVEDELAASLTSIVEAISRHEFLPNMTLRDNQELVFDCRYEHIQPYLFKMTVAGGSLQGGGGSSSSTSGDGGKYTKVVKRLLQDFNNA